MSNDVSMGLQIEGLGGLKAVLGIMREAISSEELERAVEGTFRPMTAPGGVGQIVDEEYTLEVAIQTRFENQGRDAYRDERWIGLLGEPLYLAHKRGQGGGLKTGTWYGSHFPLSETFKRGDPDHIEYVRRTGPHDVEWSFGSARGYAEPFHAGGREQPWDGMPTPGRPILPDERKLLFRYVKAIQRVMVGRMIEAQRSPGAELRGIRVEPPD